MALIDRDRRYVDINQAVIDLYQYPRAEIIGQLAGHKAVDGKSLENEALWRQLVRTNELYADRLVVHANGTHLRVSYAAHATTVGGRWLALVVTLSAQCEEDGRELINIAEPTRTGGESKLTRREREVVRLVTLGGSTRDIAADLCLSPDTVRSHVRNAMGKTGSRTRAQLVAIALAEGLIDEA